MAPVVVAAAALAATAYVGLVDPNQPGHYPLCPTKVLTGLDCPFCGGLRATHSLAHGAIGSAVDHNALVTLVVVPTLLVLWLVWIRRAWTGTTPAPRTEPSLLLPVLLWSALALMVAFTVVRNVDAVPALAWLGSSA